MNSFVFVKKNYLNYLSHCTVTKRNGLSDTFSMEKILSGVDKSAQRSGPKFSKLTEEEKETFVENLMSQFYIYDIKDGDTMATYFIEDKVSKVLGEMYPEIQKTYNSYNSWKSTYADSFCKVKSEIEDVYLRGDRSNANTDSQFVSTKRCIGYNIFNKELYQMNFMTPIELKECKDGYIYIHDMVARNDTHNCMLFRMEDVMKNGFEMGDMWYTEPNSLASAFNVMLATIKSAAAQQYGGFTVPRIDTLLAYYAQKSYEMYLTEEIEFAKSTMLASLPVMYKNTGETKEDYDEKLRNIKNEVKKLCEEKAKLKVRRDFEQGFQAMEYDLNTIGSSRGDYPFVTVTFGLDTSVFGKMATKLILEVRKNGEGKSGQKKIVAFPKLVFLYDENLHGEGKESYDLYQAALECESAAMYPDMLSLTGEGYVPSIYKKYGLAISPMGKNDTTAHVKPSEPQRGCQRYILNGTVGNDSLNVG